MSMGISSAPGQPPAPQFIRIIENYQPGGSWRPLILEPDWQYQLRFFRDATGAQRANVKAL